jgi:GLTT repeat (6 copies)
VPNRRRRRLATAMSAVAALAVTSPFAYVAICDLAADTKPADKNHEFVRAAVMTDLPSELMSALTQGLSQFGVNLPPVPSLTGASNAGLTSPGLTSPGLSPGLTSPGLTSPGLTSPGLTSPGLTSPGPTSPGLTSPGTTPGLTTPNTVPGLMTDPALTDPSLTSPGAVTPGLTSPGGIDPALTSPSGLTPSLPPPSEMPISAPIGGMDPGLGGTYPILGDPSLGGAPAASGGGGLVSDVMSAANQLGASQAIDLLKGVLMPGITQAMQGANPAAVAAAPAAAAPAPPT